MRLAPTWTAYVLISPYVKSPELSVVLLRLIRINRCQEILHHPHLVSVLGILVGNLLSVRMYAQVSHAAFDTEAKLFGIAAVYFDPPQLRLLFHPSLQR